MLPELQEMVLSFLDYHALCTARLTCRQLSRLARAVITSAEWRADVTNRRDGSS